MSVSSTPNSTRYYINTWEESRNSFEPGLWHAGYQHYGWRVARGLKAHPLPSLETRLRSNDNGMGW